MSAAEVMLLQRAASGKALGSVHALIYLLKERDYVDKSFVIQSLVVKRDYSLVCELATCI